MIGRIDGTDDKPCLAKNLRNCRSIYFEGYLWKDQRFPSGMVSFRFEKSELTHYKVISNEYNVFLC